MDFVHYALINSGGQVSQTFSLFPISVTLSNGAVVYNPSIGEVLSDNSVLVNVIYAPKPEYDPNTQNCMLNSEPTLEDGVWTIGWTVTTMTPEQKAAHDAEVKAQNKQQATILLSNTDWTALPSVADPAQSNPYLGNQAAFLDYRSQVRAIAVNPPTTLVESWPILPAEEWKSV